MQAIQLINRALKLAGITAAREEPQGEDVSTGLEILNGILELWSATPLALPTANKVVIQTVAGQSSYNVSPPIVQILTGNVISGDKFQTVLDTADNQLQNTYNYQSSPGRPYNVYLTTDYNFIDLDTGQATSTVQFFPVPDAVYTITLLAKQALDNVKYYDDLNIPPFARVALQYELAFKLCAEYGLQVSPTLNESYRDALQKYKSANKVDLSVSTPNPFGYNWRLVPGGFYYG